MEWLSNEDFFLLLHMKTLITAILLIFCNGIFAQNSKNPHDLYLKSGDTIKCKIVDVSKSGIEVQIDFDGETISKSYPLEQVRLYDLKNSIPTVKTEIKPDLKIDPSRFDDAGKTFMGAGGVFLGGTFASFGLIVAGYFTNKPTLVYAGTAVGGVCTIISFGLIIDGGQKLRMAIHD